MICTQCKEKEIGSPKMTGELCTSCYFKNKRNENAIIQKALSDPNLIFESSGPIEPIIEKAIEDRSLNETSETLDENESIKHEPKKSLEIPQDGKKYCQSCIERGYGLVLATHEWMPSYFICDDCWNPLINNIVQVERAEVKRIKTEVKLDSPALNQIYEILGIPEQLRFNNSEQVINSRNDIFNYHAQAIVNMNLDEVKNRIEFLQTVLFNIRYAVDPYQDYINREKAKQRELSGLVGLEKSKKEVTKNSSKVKLSDEEKAAKSLGMTVEKYREIVKQAKEKTFNKIVS